MHPSVTLLQYLRSQRQHKGIKEGCGEGDCGACTVVLAEPGNGTGLKYRAVNACLLMLPMVHGKQVITVENLAVLEGHEIKLHPVQQALTEHHGIQCGYCTPGMVMSLFALYKSPEPATAEEIKTALAGNLCRCTGYRSILDAALETCSLDGKDHFTDAEDDIIRMLGTIREESTALTLSYSGQQYMLPFTLDQALAFLSDYPDSLIINGGTDVVARQNKYQAHYPLIIDISHIDDLALYYEDHNHWFIGSGLHLEELRDISHDRIPALYALLSVFASGQIRNVATVGGNIATASPIGDLLPWLLIMDARVHLSSLRAKREVSLSGFITGYRSTDKHKDEIITLVSIPKPPVGTDIFWHKVSNRKDMDISSVSACIRLHLDNEKIKQFRIVYGGMAATPVHAEKAEAFLVGKEWNRDTVNRAMEIVYEEFQPLSDARSDATTRRQAAANLLLLCWEESRKMSSGNKL